MGGKHSLTRSEFAEVNENVLNERRVFLHVLPLPLSSDWKPFAINSQEKWRQRTKRQKKSSSKMAKSKKLHFQFAFTNNWRCEWMRQASVFGNRFRVHHFSSHRFLLFSSAENFISLLKYLIWLRGNGLGKRFEMRIFDRTIPIIKCILRNSHYQVVSFAFFAHSVFPYSSSTSFALSLHFSFICFHVVIHRRDIQFVVVEY